MIAVDNSFNQLAGEFRFACFVCVCVCVRKGCHISVTDTVQLENISYDDGAIRSVSWGGIQHTDSDDSVPFDAIDPEDFIDYLNAMFKQCCSYNPALLVTCRQIVTRNEFGLKWKKKISYFAVK